MTVVVVLRLLLSVASELIAWANNRSLIKAGEARELARQMEITSVRINKAAEARERARASLNIDPSKLHEDDGYRRD